MKSQAFERIYEIIQKIPKGKVVTYGQVAALAGYPGAARTVGWALGSLTGEKDLPWHRVINASGKSSLAEETQRKLQQALLEAEGVVFDENGKVDLEKFRWKGK
ncbi:MGMT family protein [candidate division KSB1 bacterium]|nr:MGMT family protein [candidate division KSB1 bacterium]NIR72695.1 MGMT family protein [candidate division KSB1 bacterium]NIS26780.1 MGMT family protein [candidate division KSB1 bacterium]NIT73574.1 MGMT family protein [candidate division KSB1 bacterium]NIU27450.1 MGMT family protein [candidate division KSB1 bacterium]